MPIQQHVLNWLYSVLTSEYQDVNRTYNDVAQTLSRFPTLSPRTDVHTFPSGASALLLHLSGTVPVNFRGNTYKFPLSVWVPHAYPHEPPLIYVTPTGTMMVRPGQHVDPQGQVYHPYLVNWPQFWDKSTLCDFLAVLSDVFAKEPPVVSRQQHWPAESAQQPVQSKPQVPPHPPHIPGTPTSQTSPSPIVIQSKPPPPPPKPQYQAQSEMPRSTAEGPPPPPPLPSKGDRPTVQGRPTRYDFAPPRSQQPRAPDQNPDTWQASSPQLAHSPRQTSYAQAPKPQQHQSYPDYGQIDPRKLPPPLQRMPNVQDQLPAWTDGARRAQRPAALPPPPDLMDEPLIFNMPSASDVAPPPIPPNPEKDALLRQLAQTLASIRHQSRQQNESSMAGLRAQRSAILAALPAIQSEMGQLTQLSNLLTSNATVLHDALRKADGVIKSSKSHPAPDIDELLVAPTVVSNQLYTLVAEERAIGDAIFMLGRAVERGRIPTAVFIKMTRSLAREWYMKKALVRKIGQGMSLQL